MAKIHIVIAVFIPNFGSSPITNSSAPSPKWAATALATSEAMTHGTKAA